MPDDSIRLAVLIDADNSSGDRAEAILAEVADHGTATVKRAYGDWTSGRLEKWQKRLHTHAIQPIQQFAYTTGKNATDSALIIDAMDLLYAGNVDGFVLVSSDSDFTPLAIRLRESGRLVYGIGKRDTPRAFVEACNRFIFLEVLGQDRQATRAEPAEPAPTKPVELPNLQSILTRAINATAPDEDDGWATLSAVGSQLYRIESSFDPRLYGYSKLVELAQAQPYVDVERNGTGPVRVRLRSSRPAKKTAAKQAPDKTAARKR
ncbi:MAG TPA: NYN domain-containing protein [Nocardioides sp.]|uniref:NYN domain-containing protein n=1 Tax=Nocardioides sp. TaxID=35761 RepID=UPI002B605308|nr:NYN domain-containing protein [Nocardioides sp.]HQR26738.1 NYN domain-containing protein [Nocardioides sp.]